MSSYQNVMLPKRPVTEMFVTKTSITKVSFTKTSWIRVYMPLYTIHLQTTKLTAHFIACVYSTILHITKSHVYSFDIRTLNIFKRVRSHQCLQIIEQSRVLEPSRLRVFESHARANTFKQFLSSLHTFFSGSLKVLPDQRHHLCGRSPMLSCRSPSPPGRAISVQMLGCLWPMRVRNSYSIPHRNCWYGLLHLRLSGRRSIPEEELWEVSDVVQQEGLWEVSDVVQQEGLWEVSDVVQQEGLWEVSDVVQQEGLWEVSDVVQQEGLWEVSDVV